MRYIKYVNNNNNNFEMEAHLVDLLIKYCDHILRFSPLVSAYAYRITYKYKATRKSRFILNDNRNVNEACLWPSIVRDWYINVFNRAFFLIHNFGSKHERFIYLINRNRSKTITRKQITHNYSRFLF